MILPKGQSDVQPPHQDSLDQVVDMIKPDVLNAVQAFPIGQIGLLIPCLLKKIEFQQGLEVFGPAQGEIIQREMGQKSPQEIVSSGRMGPWLDRRDILEIEKFRSFRRGNADIPELDILGQGTICTGKLQG